MINSLIDNPVTILFVIIMLGMLINKVKIFNISILYVGVLFVSVALGYILTLNSEFAISDESKNMFSVFSDFGSSLFISIIGISAGNTLTKKIKQYLFPMLIGMLMPLFAAIILVFIAKIDCQTDKSIYLGIFCGAITSSPGLAVTNEMPEINANLSTIGYCCSYVIGLSLIIIITQLGARKIKVEEEIFNHLNSFDTNNILLILSINIVCGKIIGNINFPLTDIPIGSTIGIIISGIIIGLICKKININNMENNAIAEFIRNLGLLIFLVCNGIQSGREFLSIFNLKYLAYGFLIAFGTIIGGYVFCLSFKNTKAEKLAIICGGMTSSPAMIALKDKVNNSNIISSFTIAYISSLLTTVFEIKILDYII